jgi:hypothetical protein
MMEIWRWNEQSFKDDKFEGDGSVEGYSPRMPSSPGAMASTLATLADDDIFSNNIDLIGAASPVRHCLEVTTALLCLAFRLSR